MTPWESCVRSPGPATPMYSPGGAPIHYHSDAEEYVPVPVAPRAAPPAESLPAEGTNFKPQNEAPIAPGYDRGTSHSRQGNEVAEVPVLPVVRKVSTTHHKPVAAKVSSPVTAPDVPAAPEAVAAKPTTVSPIELRPEPAPSVTSKVPAGTHTIDPALAVAKPKLEVRRIPAVEVGPQRNVPVASEEFSPLPQEFSPAVDAPRYGVTPVPPVEPVAVPAPQAAPAKTHLANLLNPLREVNKEETARRISGPARNNPLR